MNYKAEAASVRIGWELVEKEDQVKGCEFSRGQFVLFSSEEMKVMDARSTTRSKLPNSFR